MKDKQRRTIMKSLTWRIVATGTTLLVAFVITRNAGVTFSIGGVDLIVKTVAYYSHERAWNRVTWGKR